VRFALAIWCLALWCTPASADDLERGRALFEPCRACHALDPAEGGKAGPNLAGLAGRKVAGDANFDYSPVLRQAGAEGRRWDEASLDKFLTDPEEMFPGLWMSIRRISDSADRAALVRFLTSPNSR
jgi:cytochrome c